MTANIIILNNKFCRIENEDDKDFLKLLNNHLSYKETGAEYSPAYQRYGWNGMHYLMSKRLEFMLGLLDRVRAFYTSSDKKYNIIDKRMPFIPNEPFDILSNLKEMNITPYDFQIKGAELSLTNDRMIFKHATGSGKSVLIALITAKINKPTIVYVISKDLLFQFKEVFEKIFKTKIGIVGAGHCEIEPITIVSVWTLGRMLGLKKTDILSSDEYANEDDELDETNSEKVLNYLKTVKVACVDECHISATKTINTIYRKIDVEKIFGFSGTPNTGNESDIEIEGVFGNKIDEVKASPLIQRGILAKPYIKFVYSKGISNYKDSYPTVYSNCVVENNLRNNIIMREAKSLIDKGYQVLVLFKTIKHGKILRDLFEENEIECSLLNGKDTDEKRMNVKKQLMNKEANCLIASMIFDIGIDIPSLTALILAGGGTSAVKTLQRVGRVIRGGSKDKRYVAIIDIYDDCKYLKKHSVRRSEIYATEPEFVIQLPKHIKK